MLKRKKNRTISANFLIFEKCLDLTTGLFEIYFETHHIKKTKGFEIKTLYF